MLSWGTQPLEENDDMMGLVSLSVSGDEGWYLFFLRCRRRSRMKIPIRARAAIALTTTPAMRPAEGPESGFDGDGSREMTEDEEAGPSEEDAETALQVDEEVEVPIFVIVMVPFSSPAALIAVNMAAILVRSTGVGKAFTTPPATLSITVVGTVTPLLDRIDDTSPTILDKKLPICRFRCACSFRTSSTATLPASRQVLWASPCVMARSAWAHGPET